MSILNNVNQLRSQTIPTQGFVVEVLGYFTPGDGGGGTFFWDEGSKYLPDDGWDVIQINNNNTGK